jgi:tRNA A-37 threonylcarbamoyl transferase component Bud32
MTLHLRDIGIATAYAAVGVGDVDDEMRNAAAAVRNLKNEPDRPAVSDPASIFLLGQADVATTFETPDFKHVFALQQYPHVTSRASAVNWVFSVPYAIGNDNALPAAEGFRFTLHLRLRRAVYAYPGIEEKIVSKLAALLGKHNNKDARIQVGLGWSDLIIDGTFTPDTFSDLIAFVIDVHGLRIRYGVGRKRESFAILQRILTIIGYTGRPPAFPKVDRLTFLRAIPGKYDAVSELLRKYGKVYILDGKADFMVDSRKSKADWLEEQRKLGDGRYAGLLRKVETHLMFFPATKFGNKPHSRNLFLDVGPTALHKEECGCEGASTEPVRTIDAKLAELTGRKLVPTEQRYAIHNTLFLLAATLRDTSICCDAREAVLASYDGLLMILDGIYGKGADLDDLSYEQYLEITDLWRKLDDWHRFSDLILRQRTVGSYEEILGQSDRSVVYTGGVQKFLYLADQLIVDFAKRVEPFDTPKFSTIYDSVKTPFSFRTGVVRVPTSKIFNFPLVVADLWHEVGVTLFFLRYAEEIRKRAPEKDRNALLAHLADHYADMLVYLYGFRGDLQKFLVSFAYGWNVIYRDLAPSVARHSVADFLLRGYLVYELHEVRALYQSKDQAKVEAFFSTPDATISRLVAEFAAKLRSVYAKAPFDEADLEVLKKNASQEDVNDYHRKLYHPFVDTKVEPIAADLTAFQRGELATLDDHHDLNALFSDLANSLAMHRLQRNRFSMMASLGKSAAIEYHRRQITKSVARPAPPSSTAPTEPGEDAIHIAQTLIQEDHLAQDSTVPKVQATPVTTFLSYGNVIGERYSVIRHRDSGALADVYHVYDERLRNERALKLTRAADAAREFDRLREEVNVAMRVKHRNVCTLYDLDRTGSGVPFIVMDYIGGPDLKRFLIGTGYPAPQRAVAIARDLCAGLHAIHAVGIVHRDLKPANVMFNDLNHAVITDFGLATLVEHRPRGLEGTLLYMSPEQLDADAVVTTASDIYALGLVLFELFSGQQALKGSSPVQVAASQKAVRRVRPSTIVAAIPPRAEKLIMECLANDPHSRPSAEELEREFTAIAASPRPR